MSEAPASRPRRHKAVVIVVAALAGVVAAAWVGQSLTSSGAGETRGSPAPTSYSIVVERDGKALKRYDLAALHALPQARVVIDHKAQTGPWLSTVLRDAGAGSFTRVYVRGAGIRDDGHLMLTAAQVTQRVVVDFTERGTVKVCGPDLLRPDWVRDVISIDAR